MSFKMNHIHLKTTDPEATAKFYVDSLGAMIVGKAGDSGFRLDLHGLSINVTKHIESQTRDQVYGIEHIAIDTDDLDNVVADLKANGARILEETQVGNGRRVCFFEGPDGVQLEVLELEK
jgi:catechol 2,3-dioxygenase-like lactoylglutathione lyase family enzyme